MQTYLFVVLPWLDCNVEKWCQDLGLNHAALLTADTLHTELINTLKRIELPVSVPAFGSRNNTLNIKKALLAGFFMQVRYCPWTVYNYSLIFLYPCGKCIKAFLFPQEKIRNNTDSFPQFTQLNLYKKPF